MKFILPAAAALLLQFAGFAQNGYQKTPKGMFYRIIPTGSGPLITGNHVVRFHIEQRVNDSIIFSSFGKGLSVVNLKSAGNLDEQTGIFKKMRAGDSLVTLNLANDLLNNKELVLPDFIHAGDSLFQCVRVVDIFPSEQAYKNFKTQDEARKLAADQKLIEAYLKAEKIVAAKTPKGSYMQVLKKGSGLKPVKGSTVYIRYTGRTLNGVLFDSNEQPGDDKPLLDFETGKGLMIAGFEEAATLLSKGGRCRVFLPSVLAYGEGGSGDLIAPNEVLVFELELVKFTPPKKKPATVKKN